MARTGSCYCRNVEYELTDDSKNGVICHCKTCHKLHSSGSLNIQTSTDKVKVTKGSPKTYKDQGTDSGTAIVRYFCGDCGSALWSDPEGMPGVRFLKAGSLDDTNGIKLAAEIYVDTAIPFEVYPKNGQKQFEGMMKKEV